MEIFIGTSGWSYDWNEGNSLEWYINNSNLNAIELNMSFYRFPYPNMVKSWAKKGKDLIWIVKIHRSITHHKKLSKGSYDIFKRFKNIFKPLEDKIHYYLLQLPPHYKNIEALDLFLKKCNCEKICVEFRDESLFNDEIIKWGKKHDVLVASIDAPEMPRQIMSKKIIYERIHGRTGWYSHDYSRDELLEIKNRIYRKNPEKVYIFFNNDHMFENAKAMNSILRQNI